MNIKKLIVAMGILSLSFANNAFASKLPNDVWEYIKTNLPSSKQRFDSVVTVSDDIMYIPLYPPSDKTVDSIQIEYTYPANKKLSQLPEVVLLNNGYSLLKVFKDESGNYTLTKKDDLPIKVRLGLMPQDMLTPAGLKMPESLTLTLGDLLIPSKEETSLVLKDEDKARAQYSQAVQKNEFIAANELKNKKIFINPKNSKFLEVYDSTNQSALYELKLSSMPQKIISSDENKVALILYWGDKNVEIIDLKDENIIATITLDENPTDVAYNKKENLAYITSQKAGAIYVVSLNSMSLTKVVKLDQKPSKINYNGFDNSIAFYDEYQSKVYHVTKNGEEFIVQPMGTVKNVSAIETDVANIYALSRTDNLMYVFDKTQGKLIVTVDVDKKPTDILRYKTKLFILCSKEGYIDVYDTVSGKIVSKEKIASEGFYSKMTKIPNEENLIITGVNSSNYIIYNLEKMKPSKIQTSYINVNNVVIMDKAQKL